MSEVGLSREAIDFYCGVSSRSSLMRQRADDVHRLGFALDKVTCEALLGVLLDTGVLTKDRAGHYLRYFPPRHTAAA